MTRVKNDGARVPENAIDAVLRMGGITRRDVDHIATIYGWFAERHVRRKTMRKELERKVNRGLRALTGRGPSKTNVPLNEILRGVGIDGMGDYFRRDQFLADEGFRKDARLHFIDHHLTHAAAAAFYSGFPEAAVVTMDGEGDLRVHHTASVLRGGRLDCRHVSSTLGTSPGHFYEAITEFLGFTPLRHEGKVLGLAAYGDPKPLAETFRRAMRSSDDARGFASDFAGLEAAEVKRREHVRKAMAGHSREDVSAAAQLVFEEAIVRIIGAFLRETGMRKLALNGGVFANVKVNQRLAALPEVDSLFVFPAMSDTGNSIGAALMVLDRLEPGFLQRAGHALQDVYWGPGYDEAAIRSELERSGLAFERLDEGALVERAAQSIHAGKVVGWFQGRMEFGPRALGDRSIVGRPTDALINQTLNDRLDRSEFMPFAPSVLDEHAGDVFANVDKGRHTAQFMTMTFDVAPHWRERVPAVVHVDGTARPHLVRKSANPVYWNLIERYRQLSGIPLVLNTSFNVHEEPIVCAPKEAVQAILGNRVDCLAAGPFWVEQPAPRR